MSGVFEASRGAIGDMKASLTLCTSLRHAPTFAAFSAVMKLELSEPAAASLTAGVVERECAMVGLTEEVVEAASLAASAEDAGNVGATAGDGAISGGAGGATAAGDATESSSSKSAWRRSELLLCTSSTPGEAGAVAAGGVGAVGAAATLIDAGVPGRTKLAGTPGGVAASRVSISLLMKEDAEPGVANIPRIPSPNGVCCCCNCCNCCSAPPPLPPPRVRVMPLPLLLSEFLNALKDAASAYPPPKKKESSYAPSRRIGRKRRRENWEKKKKKKKKKTGAEENKQWHGCQHYITLGWQSTGRCCAHKYFVGACVREREREPNNF